MRLKEKQKEVKELLHLIESHRTILIADLYKVRSIQKLRKELRGKLLLRASKNSLFKRAIEMSKKPRISSLSDYLTGSNIFIFTNMNLFDACSILRKTKIRLPARAGDIASSDIWVSEGNTGIPAGPVVSEFAELNIPVKIEAGAIRVVKDTLLVKKGESISPKVASMLRRLNIFPIDLTLPLKVAYEDGTIFTKEYLEIDESMVSGWILKAREDAFNLAVRGIIFTNESIPWLLKEGYLNSVSLANEAFFFTPITVQNLLIRAWNEAQLLSSCLERA